MTKLKVNEKCLFCEKKFVRIDFCCCCDVLCSTAKLRKEFSGVDRSFAYTN